MSIQINEDLELYFSVQERLLGFQTFLLTLGGALIGATAIAFALIMFAMQVNVERMPFGLFRKFSSDPKLLGCFVLTFILAISVICLSLIPDSSWITIAILGALWNTVFIVIFFLIAYRRALNLISPTQQLTILLNDILKNFRAWSNAASRISPALTGKNADEDERPSEHDFERFTFFQLSSGWTSVAEKGVAHCISFARRYAEQGDHEVSGYALDTIVSINAGYINTKGKTFFSTNYLIDTPLATDSFINNTLEHLRQNVQIGISRSDENQIEHTLSTFSKLCYLYTTIDYSSDHASKFHAHLASGYLCDAVEAVLPHNKPDVLMEGVKLMGDSATYILSKKEPDFIRSITDKISVIACAGIVNHKYRPVTQLAVKQLAILTFQLLRSEVNHVQFALDNIKGNIKLIAEIHVKTPDTVAASIHSSNLSAFFSTATNESLMYWLTELTNSISVAEADDINAQRVIGHLVQWSDGMYRIMKDLLLDSIENKSGFKFDVTHSIVHMTKILLAASNAEACSEHDSDELREHAHWLIMVLSWIPDEKEKIIYAENYQITEQIFEVAIDAWGRGCEEIAISIKDLLLSWAFKAGKYQTGWMILERALYGLACLNLIYRQDDEVLLNKIQEKIDAGEIPEFEDRFRVSEEIRNEAHRHHQNRFPTRYIDREMGNVDQDRLRDLLTAIADRLVPEMDNDGNPEE